MSKAINIATVQTVMEEERNGVIQATGGVDCDLLESALRLATGAFVGRVHVINASFGANVVIYDMEFNTPQLVLKWQLRIDVRNSTFTIKEKEN